MARSTSRWRPSAVEVALLQAALLDSPEAARRAFEQWAANQVLEGELVGSNRMFPLLLAAARRHGWSDAVLERVRAEARGPVMFSGIVSHCTRNVLGDLTAIGVVVLLLKGLALQQLVYADPSLRPVTDCDVLVRPGQGQATFDYLVAQGWRTDAKSAFGPGELASYAGMNFYRDRHEQLDLHWRLSFWSGDPTLDQRVWERSQSLLLDDLEVRTLDSTDHLLHAVAHGIAWEQGFTTRWVPDVMRLIGTGQIDWSRLLDEAERAGFLCGLREAIAFLQEEMACAIPAAFVERLRSTRPRVLDRATHWVRTSPPTPARSLARFFVIDYLLPTAGYSWLRRVARYPSYLYRRVSTGEETGLGQLFATVASAPRKVREKLR